MLQDAEILCCHVRKTPNDPSHQMAVAYFALICFRNCACARFHNELFIRASFGILSAGVQASERVVCKRNAQKTSNENFTPRSWRLVEILMRESKRIAVAGLKQQDPARQWQDVRFHLRRPGASRSVAA